MERRWKRLSGARQYLCCSGVYCLSFSTPDGELEYIGSSKNILKRVDTHIRHFQNGKQPPLLQDAWDTYGEPKMNVRVLEECKWDDLRLREQYWIDKTMPSLNSSKAFSADSPGLCGWKIERGILDFEPPPWNPYETALSSEPQYVY